LARRGPSCDRQSSEKVRSCAGAPVDLTLSICRARA
jgi:hypothetical protein